MKVNRSTIQPIASVLSFAPAILVDGTHAWKLRVRSRITSHSRAHLYHHLRPLLNREILNVDLATPAVSLNRSRPNLVQS